MSPQADTRLTLGAMPQADGTKFRVWAPKPSQVTLHLEFRGAVREVLLPDLGGGYREVSVPGVRAGAKYGYFLDGRGPFPDPCSRSQPDGVHGLSEVVNPWAFPWSDRDWALPDPHDLLIYECHIGTLTPRGTFDGAIELLPGLRQLGVNAIELMPVASFPGRWNWGYDGVAAFAPAAVYGGPEGMRRFVDAAHREGLAVLLDVVYNHFGPDGNYTGLYSDHYATDRYRTPWGAAINFDGPGSEHVRRFFTENLQHWCREFHVDGFRIDAAHEIFDTSPEHILATLRRATEGLASGGSSPLLFAESDENDPRYVRAQSMGGYGLDGIWADDFHHAVHRLVTRESDGYYGGFAGTPEEVARAITQGFVYEGQVDPTSGKPRGYPARDARLGAFVCCLQNHDQVGNRAFGDRLSATVGRPEYMAASLLLLLLPQTPLLFQGQEYAASQPFCYFTDHDAALGRLVTEGRRHEFAGFPAFGSEAARARIPDPQAPATFEMSRLNPGDQRIGLAALTRDFYAEAARIRHTDPVLADVRAERDRLSAFADGKLVHIQFSGKSGTRSLVVNFGSQDRSVRLETTRARLLITSAAKRWGWLGPEASVGEDTLYLPGHGAAFVAIA